jgi:hypothetical protein
MLEEARDTGEIIERVAALDIGKAELVCCVRVPDAAKPGRRLQEVTPHSTMTRSLLVLADRLRGLGVTRVVMEATSVYWKAPVRHEASGIEWRCKDFTAGQSQLTGEAGGSRDVGTHATVGAALTTYGTGRHCQTARVRLALMRRRTRGTAV